MYIFLNAEKKVKGGKLKMLGRGCRDQVEVGSKTEGIHLEKEKEYLSDVEEKSKTIKV